MTYDVDSGESRGGRGAWTFDA